VFLPNVSGQRIPGRQVQEESIQRDLIMMKSCLLAVALLSLALASGCAKGGSGVAPIPVTITVTANDVNANAIYPTQSVTLAATVANSTATAVTWSLGSGCTPSTCGTITPVTPPTTPATATFVAPATPTSVTVTATLVANTSVTGPLTITVVDVTTDVAPATLNVGSGLTQQFTAVAVPDNAATQSFTWTCSTTVNGTVTGSCANFSPDPNVSGLAYYTAADSCSGVGCIEISAASTLDPAGCTPNPKNCTVAKASLVASRVSGTYAFRFSGYDSNNNATAVVGTFTASSNGTITSGEEDVLTANGPSPQPIQVTGGSYTPTSSDPNNSNNAGKLTLTLPTGVYPNQYQVVLNGAGDLKMIESDGHGTGSGIAQISSGPSLLKGNQTYAFGFTGVDSGGSRVGFVGVLEMNGSGVISGQMDTNDNGTNICGGSPCSVTGTYSADQTVSGLWHMVLTSGSLSINFDFFIASGTTTNKTSPLTFYAISTGPFDNTHPEVSGTMVLQDSSQTYNSAAFNGTSVSALTGTVANGVNGCVVPLGCANVSLTLGSTDGKGNFAGLFDQNNAGTVLSGVQFPPTTGANNYTYAASGTNGRYTFNMLGDPTTTPTGAPLPFVLYASGANRGFLLDQKSSSVMTGTMNPQGKGSGLIGGSTLPGTYAAATTHSGSSGVDPIAANLLLTWTNSALNTGACTAECVNGTQYDTVNYSLTSVPLAGAYTIQDIGNGTIVLTAPSAQNYAIYVLDTSGCSSNQDPVCAIQDFLMMDEDKTNPNPSIIFAQQ
jgi:hypothetical protein